MPSSVDRRCTTQRRKQLQAPLRPLSPKVVPSRKKKSDSSTNTSNKPEYVFPSCYGRYGSHRPMSAAALNWVTTSSWEYAQKDQQPPGKFDPRDMRCAGSTILHEAGYNSD